MKFISPIFLLLTVCSVALSQGFIAEIDDDDIGVILKSPTTVVLQNGDSLKGELTSASLVNGYLKNVVLKAADGSKRKLQPEEMASIWVKASSLAKMAMMNESGSSIFRLTKTNFDDIINREYIIFEQALRATKKDKPAMMQLLNPGFDHVIKVYADPNAKETSGLSIEGISITGGKDKSYLFVKGNNKVVIVKKGSYKKNFDELYGDCRDMMLTFEGEKKKFNDMAGHVFVYDQICNK
jgi:small nuclear ribonucleoprotein (snRNP)-like protein